MQWVEALLRQHVRDGKLPGGLVHVSAGPGRPIATCGHGYAEDAIFRMYSQSKAVTAVAVLILLERGRIRSLDDEVARYIPAFRSHTVLVADGKERA
eukprot:gene151-2284_t